MINSDFFSTMLEKDAAWCRHLGFNDFDGLNRILRDGKAVQLVNLCEARHENFCSTIAADIAKRKDVKMVLLAGPSSSGKTSTSLRIALQCKVHGFNPKTIELDNYFKSHSQTPRLPNGDYDFECLEAMDTELLNSQLKDLLHGKEVELPYFDFANGKNRPSGHTMKLQENDILIMEGIHALDPAMTPDINDSVKYKIYVSVASSIAETTPSIQNTGCRLLRRIIRDNRARNYNAETTILRWPSVREGEEKYIFPFESEADAVFNSSLQYELPLIKYHAQPLLRSIADNSEAFAKASELLEVLDHIDPLPLDGILAIPATSIMREFTGHQALSRELL